MSRYSQVNEFTRIMNCDLTRLNTFDFSWKVLRLQVTWVVTLDLHHFKPFTFYLGAIKTYLSPLIFFYTYLMMETTFISVLLCTCFNSPRFTAYTVLSHHANFSNEG